MEQVKDWIEKSIGLSPDVQEKILATIITIFALWLIRRIILFFTFKTAKDVRIQYRWRKTTVYIVFTIGFLLVGRIWFDLLCGANHLWLAIEFRSEIFPAMLSISGSSSLL